MGDGRGREISQENTLWLRPTDPALLLLSSSCALQYPYLVPLLEQKKRADIADNKVAFTRNTSRRTSIRRRELRKRRAVGRFNVIPLIVRMQRTWREFLAIKHSKREIAKAYALLKRMREDRISGQEFFRRLKAEHCAEIALAVEFNLKKRQLAIEITWKEWVNYTNDRLQRKAALYRAVRKRKCKILEAWFAEVMVEKREVINRIRPNLFPPLLSDFVRYSKDNNWIAFLQSLSDLFSEFDSESRVRTLKYEEFTTMKVIGYKNFTELNEMLTFYISQSYMRKKVTVFVGNKDPEASLSFAFWQWLHDCSIYLWTKASETNARNQAATRQEEIGLLQRFMHHFLMKRNLNPPSFSEKFRIRSKSFLTWHCPEELCTRCLAILPILQIQCDRCGSEQKPRFMRDTQVTIHTNLESDGVRGDIRGIVYQKGLRRGKRKENIVKGVMDIDEPVDLFVYHAMFSMLAPVGSWRRLNSTVEEAWMYGVRDGMQYVHGIKRRGIFSIADLYNVMVGDADTFDTLFLDPRLRDKIRGLLHLLEDVLHDALGEDEVKKETQESAFGGSSVTDSSWRRLTISTASANEGKKRRKERRARNWGRGREVRTAGARPITR